MQTGMSMKSISLLERIIRLVFPVKCMVCETILKEDTPTYLCEPCEKDLKRYGRGFEKNRALPDVDSLFAGFYYLGGVETAIHTFKFKNQPKLSETISCLLYEELNKNEEIPEFDYIVPVPMHPKKKRQRGYNQSELIAKQLAVYLKKEVRTDILVKTRYTSPQSLLKRKERISNLKDVFSVCSDVSVEGRSILVVDDVLTTGTTMNTCARILKDKGASVIYSIVIAIAEK